MASASASSYDVPMARDAEFDTGGALIVATLAVEGAMRRLDPELTPRVFGLSIPWNSPGESRWFESLRRAPHPAISLEGIDAVVARDALTAGPLTSRLAGGGTSTETVRANLEWGAGAVFTRELQARLDSSSDAPRRWYLASHGMTRGNEIIGIVLELAREPVERADATISANSGLCGSAGPISLVRSVATSLMSWAVRALPTASSLKPGVAISSDELLRDATVELLRQLGLGGQAYELHGLFDFVASRPHEGAPCEGELRFIEPDVAAQHGAVRLLNPVPLNHASSGALRKLLVASRVGVAVGCSGVPGDGPLCFPALAATSLLVPPCDSQSVSVRFSRGSRWEVLVDARPMVVVDGGQVRLPDPPRQVEFENRFRVAFGPDNDAGMRSAWAILAAVVSGRRGAVVAIVERAAEHVSTLRAARAVAPASLRVEDAVIASRMDGALVLDPRGLVHAVGAILDGRRCDSERPERGSRFNSAVRFAREYSGTPVLVVVVSEDGQTDFIPGS